MYDTLILGAGLCGLQAARTLQAAGKSILVLDKGRGVGGRAATRRWNADRVDHGAQFFTARSPEFQAQAADWQARGVCFPWAEGFHQWDPDSRGLRPPDDEPGARHPRYACREGMSALSKDLAAALAPGTVRLETRATALHVAETANGLHWRMEIEGSSDWPVARALFSTLPAPQTLELLARSDLSARLDPAALGVLETVRCNPCLAVMLRGAAPMPDWKGIQLRDETLTWVSDDTGKRPGGDAPGERERVFVLHGGPAFSRQWQDGDLEEATRLLTARAGEIVGDWITRLPAHQIHRWRYASLDHGFKEEAGLQLARAGQPPLFVSGDAFCNAKVEGAWRSGRETARAMLAGGAEPGMFVPVG